MEPVDTQAQGQVTDPAMDTPTPTQTSETNQLATNDAPEATQGTVAQETTQTEVKAEDTAQEKLLAGKYKTVEDLEKSYKELESRYGKETSEKAELNRILNEAFAPTMPVQDTAQVDTTDAYVDEPITQPDDSVKRDMAVLKFTIGHPDADGNAMQQVLAKDPLINQITGYEAKLEYAYAKAKAESQNKTVAQATKQAQQDAQVKMVEKQAAQVETAQKAAPVNEEAELMNKAMTGRPDERAAARLAIIRKRLTKL